jgi:hypothetical protein
MPVVRVGLYLDWTVLGVVSEDPFRPAADMTGDGPVAGVFGHQVSSVTKCLGLACIVLDIFARVSPGLSTYGTDMPEGIRDWGQKNQGVHDGGDR